MIKFSPELVLMQKTLPKVDINLVNAGALIKKEYEKNISQVLLGTILYVYIYIYRERER